ncbi:hypothetical protein N9S64_00930 [Candidatus Pelagibacter sp.]|nr:hypothetical protein [Candidatus Pelagibacter sp.]MDA9631229.1 hypothetical protein [Candidatus Pelagibacter sp.]
MISYEQSKKILKKAKIKVKDESVISVNSLNRVTSSNIYSDINYPADDNAAFDGFAINSNDTKKINKKLPKEFKIIGSIAAGAKPFKKSIKKFNTVEIMTGGILPTVSNTSLGGIQPNMVSASQSGVDIFLLKSIGVGRSTLTPFLINIFEKSSKS